ncbi:MAG: hypothetical protein WD278_01540 [Pirellulales bacterium]
MRTFLSAGCGVVELVSNFWVADSLRTVGLLEGILLGSFVLLPAACCLAGCLSVAPDDADDLVVQESERLRAGVSI